MPFDKLIETLAAGDRSHATERLTREDLAATLDLAERYARIEKKVLGAAARVAYSPTSLELESHRDDDAAALGEFIATSERARLQLPDGPILELMRTIEEQGIKVLPRRLPQEYSGGFFFDEKLGPCILIQADASESALQYGLAHQYAHFMADFDPYITTLCGWPTPAVLEDPIELRAYHTALALLMPRTDLETYREAFGSSEGEALQAELVHQLRVYFELDPEQVLWRLLTLGWIDAAGLNTLLRSDARLADELRSEPRTRSEASLLPERFVRLVASAFGSGKVDLEGAAGFLGTDIDGAESILEKFEYERPAQAGAEAERGAAPRRKNGNGSRRT